MVIKKQKLCLFRTFCTKFAQKIQIFYKMPTNYKAYSLDCYYEALLLLGTLATPSAYFVIKMPFRL